MFTPEAYVIQKVFNHLLLLSHHHQGQLGFDPPALQNLLQQKEMVEVVVLHNHNCQILLLASKDHLMFI
jgi:hypothetical protein